MGGGTDTGREAASADGDVQRLMSEAIAWYRAGEWQRAETAYAELLRLEPANAEAWHNLSGALLKQGRFARARSALEKALELRPEYPEAYYNLGNVLRALGDRSAAAASYEEALRRRPHFTDAQVNLGALLKEQAEGLKSLELAERSVRHLQAVLRSVPDHVGAHVNLGGVMHELGRLDEATLHYKACLRLHPGHEAALLGLGRVLADLRHLDAAIALHKQALRANPGSASAQQCLGRDHLERGELELAEMHFRRAVELNPNNVSARASLGRLLLTLGRFEEGWPLYDLRAAVDGYDLDCFEYPMWQGEPLDGRHILVYAEQGIGDEIMFASCIPDLARRAGACSLQCDPRLAELFRRSFPGVAVYGAERGNRPEWLAQPEAIDVKCIAGSLPRHLRPTLDSFPADTAFLAADAQAAAAWRERLGVLGPGLRIGLSWRGGKSVTDRLQRSTDLASWAPVLRTAGVRFVDVQYGDHGEEIEAVARNPGVRLHRFEEVDPLRDMDGFAAMLSGLDLVITVDNSTAHLCGALGVPTWVLLPKLGDWRWLSGRVDSPWYRDLRLFRQSEWKRWDDVFEAVAGALAARAAGGGRRGGRSADA